MKDKSFPDVEYHKLNHNSSDSKLCLCNILNGLLTLLILLCTAGIALTVYRCYCSTADSDITYNHNGDNLQCGIRETDRFDCWPEKVGSTPEKCRNRGCCWTPSPHPNTAPYCFFPMNYDGYSATEVKETKTGLEATLSRQSSSFYSTDIKLLRLQVDFQTDSRLRIKIYDPNHRRYEVPLAVPSKPSKHLSPQYKVSIAKQPFSISVTRKSTGEKIFDTTGAAPLIFSDQYLQIGTNLSTNYVYGLGEHRNNFLIDVSKWERYVFWNRDDVPKLNNNGYGTHPFFLNLEKGRDQNLNWTQNNAHGVFLLNSNAGEAALQPGFITYRMLGGILDFHVMTGPQAESVVTQYADVIGRPYFPPLWSLGFHLCKFGIHTAADLKAIIIRNQRYGMPYDVQWSDIDYMQDHKDWTYDHDRYKGLPDIVSYLHQSHQHYIIMADPAISSKSPAGSYPPFDEGKQLDVFIKDSQGQILNGQVWPGQTAFPDFFHPNAEQYWYKQAKNFHGIIDFDGLWIDMNEPSNFVDGSVKGCPQSPYNNPPYVPPTIDSGSLVKKTICPSAKQNVSLHYNVHNMYGWSQANVTRKVLNRLLGKRSLIISRSTFPGSGVNTGHWLGDNEATFQDMYYSIPGILNFNMFGLPQVGADICGFRGNTTNELCTRWMQLGVFYPFMRNHASFYSKDQDPAVFPSPFVDLMINALKLRYKLLAVLYTAFYDAHVTGLPIVRPLMFYYKGTEAIDKQFLWGNQLLVSPVLTQGAKSVKAFLPNDVWYDFYRGYRMPNVGQYVTLSAPLALFHNINVHIRGGSILPLLPPTERTYLAQRQKFTVMCAPDHKGNASGHLFWDDGESLDSISSRKYTEVEFYLKNYNNSFSTRVVHSGYKPSQGIRLGELFILGVLKWPFDFVTVNGNEVSYSYSITDKTLLIFGLDEDMTKPITAHWQ